MIPAYRWSLKEQMRNPKKIFIIDNGFKTIHSLKSEGGISKLYENIVFLTLRRNQKNIFYLLDEKEIDFYLPEKNTIINVCYDISESQTLERELSSLEYGIKKLGLKEAFLITSEEEKEIKLDDSKIFIIPLWKWLLEY